MTLEISCKVFLRDLIALFVFPVLLIAILDGVVGEVYVPVLQIQEIESVGGRSDIALSEEVASEMYPINYLSKKFCSLFFLYSLLLYYVVKKFSPTSHFHNQKKLLIIFINFVKLSNTWMFYYFKNVYFSSYSFFIGFIINLALFKHFYSHFFFSVIMNSQLY